MKKLLLVAVMAALLIMSATVLAAPAPSTAFGTATFDFSTSAVSATGGVAITGAIGLGQGWAVSVSSEPDAQLNINYKFGNLGDTPLSLLIFGGIQSGNGFAFNTNGNTDTNTFGGQIGLQLGIPLSESWQAYVMGELGAPIYKFNAGAAYFFNPTVDLHIDINYANAWNYDKSRSFGYNNGVWYPSVGVGIKL